MPLVAYKADFHILRLVMRPFIRVNESESQACP